MPRKLWTILSLLLMLIPYLLLAQTDTVTSTTTTTTETQAVETTTTETAVDTTTTEAPPVDTTTDTTTPVASEVSEEQAKAACGVCAGIGMLAPLIGLAISIGIAWWIYKDATRRGDKNAVLWAVLGFFLSLLGLVIYLVARPKTTSPPPPPTV